MGQRLDAMRAAARQKRTTGLGTAVPSAVPKPPTTPPIVHRCGHTTPAANLTNADCPMCRNKKRAQKNRAKQEAKAAKQAEQPTRGRLPVGSTFTAVWDGEKWTGDLTVPGVELTGPQSASGVKPLLRLMRLLDDDYRAAVGEVPGPECGGCEFEGAFRPEAHSASAGGASHHEDSDQ